tara:strand:+ start:53 stop:517 length:465 start_codon:yes stop_codon:yes gene_type:complete
MTLVRNYEDPNFWLRGAETLAPALRIAAFLPINAPVRPALIAAARALDEASDKLKAQGAQSETILPSESPIAPIVPDQVQQIVEQAMLQQGNFAPDKISATEPKKKRKVSKSQKNFGKALKEVKKKHPRIAKSKTSSARRQLFKKAWKLAKKMK